MNNDNKISSLFNTLNVYDSRHSVDEVVKIVSIDRTKFKYDTLAHITYTSNYDTHNRLIEKTNVINHVEFIIKLKSKWYSKDIINELCDYLVVNKDKTRIFIGSTPRWSDLYTVRVQYVWKAYAVIITAMSESLSNLSNVHKKDIPSNVHKHLPILISNYLNKYVK